MRAPRLPLARVDLLVLAAAALAVRIPAFLADRHLTFDDGVFGASAVAMRSGGRPFADVFSSQGPLFLPLVWVGDVLGGRTEDAPRVVAVLAGIALTCTTYRIARELTDRSGALIAAGLVSVCGSVWWVTAPLAADGPALALALAAVGLAIAWRDEITVRRALVLGLAVGAALSIKALAAAAVLPVAIVLLRARRIGLVLAGGLTAVALHLLLWLPWGPSEVWDQAYAYHLEVSTERTPLANLGKVLSTLGDRDLPVAVLAIAALGAALWGSRRRLDLADALLLSWLGGIVVVLLVEHPMWRPHVSQLVPPLALLAARHRPRLPLLVLAPAIVAVGAYHVLHVGELLAPSPYRGSSAEAVALLGRLPDGALAISDEPGLVWRAGARTPPDLVDASGLRIETGDISEDRIVEEATAGDVCAVAVWSSRRWGAFDGLDERLRAAGYTIAVDDDRDRRLYVGGRCSLSG